ncbi:hypothetical protein [uncultured Erythrobacter sp.]|uniref:hypothetical protein n=1 Tax=uncultured Erythrobacter sp. TaxID=263913 RepID=UPI0026204310|nr:hypothetical protein [uncultured Erythrobacter sp.]
MQSNQDKLQKMIPFQATVDGGLQRTYGQIYSRTRNCISHADQEVREAVQSELDHTVQGLMVVHLFAIWEHHVDWNTVNELIEKPDRMRLNAFRHIRNSAAHGVHLARAVRYSDEFEATMQSSKPIADVVYTSQSIDLSQSHAGLDCRMEMVGLMNRMIMALGSKVANHN